MKETKGDNWTDWLMDDKHRWENISKPDRWRVLMNFLTLAPVFLVVALISYGLYVLVLNYLNIGEICFNTILPFISSSSEFKYTLVGVILVLSLVTVIYRGEGRVPDGQIRFIFLLNVCLCLARTNVSRASYSCGLFLKQLLC